MKWGAIQNIGNDATSVSVFVCLSARLFVSPPRENFPKFFLSCFSKLLTLQLLRPEKLKLSSQSQILAQICFESILIIKLRALNKFYLSILSYWMITRLSLSFWWVLKSIWWFGRPQRAASKSSSENSASWTFLFSMLRDIKLSFHVIKSM